LFDFVMAVDAGFAHLESIGRVPDMALGDFDSLGYVPKCKKVARHPVKKDKSDLELAFDRAMNRKYEAIVVYGALGGRLDHTVANLQLFARYAERGVDVTAIGLDCAVRLVVGPDVYELPLRDEGTVSVFAMTPEAHGVIERGMEYSIDDETISNRTTRGLSNELIGEPAAVAVEEGTLLVFHPL
jgi:thiamine pyrophosphokinase